MQASANEEVDNCADVSDEQIEGNQEEEGTKALASLPIGSGELSCTCTLCMLSADFKSGDQNLISPLQDPLPLRPYFAYKCKLHFKKSGAHKSHEPERKQFT